MEIGVSNALSQRALQSIRQGPKSLREPSRVQLKACFDAHPEPPNDNIDILIQRLIALKIKREFRSLSASLLIEHKRGRRTAVVRLMTKIEFDRSLISIYFTVPTLAGETSVL